MEERPIVFTISHLGNREYSIKTSDLRGSQYNKERTQVLYFTMDAITTALNANNYAVLFEVD